MAVEISSSLVEKTKAARAINGYLLPKGPKTPSTEAAFLQLSNVYSCLILDKEGRDVLALAAVLRYTPSQAYCCLYEVTSGLKDKLLRMEAVRSALETEEKADAENQQQQSVKIVKMRDALKGIQELQPMYMIHRRPKSRPGLDQVLDAVMENALGILNLEAKKNVTVDLGETDMTVWRDRLGFCVRDNLEFLEVSFQKSGLIPCLIDVDPKDLGFEIFSSRDPANIFEYDKLVCQFSREEYLSFVINMKGSQILLARRQNGDTENENGSSLCGLAVTFDSTILFLYADGEVVAQCLLKAILAEWPEARPVTMTLVQRDWLDHLFLANEVSRTEKHLTRYHTTSAPRQINWNKVHVLNAGMHIC